MRLHPPVGPMDIEKCAISRSFSAMRYSQLDGEEEPGREVRIRIQFNAT
jgi:hypothetical protein